MYTEKKIITTIANLLVTPFNISLIALTGVIWAMVVLLPYYNTNFDLGSTLANYITFFSGGCVIASILGNGSDERLQLSATAVVSFVLSILTLLVTKSVMLNQLGHLVFLPINIFCMLLLVKNIWQVISADKKLK
jgi:hypothetical protein